VSQRTGSSHITARRTATALVAAFVVLWAARLILAASTGSLVEGGAFTSILLDTLAVGSGGLFVWVAWAIVTRQPRNTIGWLLFAIPLATAVAFFVGDYATEALVKRPGSLPLGTAAAWVDRWMIVVVLVVFIPIFLFFPDGKLPSVRWRPALWLLACSATVTVTSFALTPGRMTGAFADLTKVVVMNPLGVPALEGPLRTLTLIGGIATLLSAFLAGAAIVVRFKGAAVEVRQQIRWLRFIGISFIAEFLIFFILNILVGDQGRLAEAVGNIAFTTVFVTLVLGIPIACGIAILKYHLYDLDVVIRKTVVFGLLAVFFTVVYAGVVGVVSESFRHSSVGSFAAAIVLALLFAPARDRARKIADRLVYGKRATPYEVLADFSGRVGETYASDDVLPRMAHVLKQGTGASRARVLLRVGTQEREAAAAGEDGADEHMVEVTHQGEILGSLAVSMPPSDPMNPEKQRLIEDLAGQAGLVLRNVRLIEELRASRQRLVAAQDEERRKIERNLHDGAQQQLVALTVQLRLAEQMIGSDPNRARQTLARLQSSAEDALEDLRDLARGIYPPLLADKGLGPAIEAQARKAAVPIAVRADGLPRYPQVVESGIYFCVLEALNNVAKYSRASQAGVELRASDGVLTFRVTDDGDGFDTSRTSYGTGLQGMADRLDSIGGGLEVRSDPGAGTVVEGRVPVRQAEEDAAAQAASSRSGPNAAFGM
jgi:signal transduction histidine kinase